MTSVELHLQLNRYLSVRSALGYKMREVRRCLAGFADYVDHHRKDGPISAQLVLDWACSAKCGPAGQGQRSAGLAAFYSTCVPLFLKQRVRTSFDWLVSACQSVHLCIPGDCPTYRSRGRPRPTQFFMGRPAPRSLV